MGAEREGHCRAALTSSVKAAMDVLSGDGTAVDAVVAAIAVMEDDPMFNAGRGAVFAANGTNELDAGIMDGFTGAVGGVSTVKRIMNPIIAAKFVMQHSKHSLLCGEGAENFAFRHGCPMVLSEVTKGTVGAVALDMQGHLAAGSSTGGLSGKEPGRVSDSSISGAGFYADRRIAVSATGNGDEFIRMSASKIVLKCDCMAFNNNFGFVTIDFSLVEYAIRQFGMGEEKMNGVLSEVTKGTVGAVALDMQGHLAAGSSTGGLSGKEPGRVSDSSISGAGFYADRRIAVSATGNGDEFIRMSASKQIADLVNYRGLDLTEACAQVVHTDMKDVHAGFIALDISGTVTMPFNTPGMFRATLRHGQGPAVVEIFK
ncbi:unnamed protein product [Gongylonema pulchrum]|uniref:Isoaspartyl peptidase/L-asparaginase n=1 Tax=Gongylonema pulchrum TaxID=637853 RepID=A0A183DU20_9BILA|nr:unnamed protein product [Gongylonema pulchrum]